MAAFRFKLLQQDASSKARLGCLETAHGIVETPAFMPVATRAAVKTLTPQQLFELDTQMIIANAYHLMLRPGVSVIEKAGGLHTFMGWPRTLLTDSGGFQVFSQAQLHKTTEEGIYFQSHIDGSKHFWDPQENMRIQKALGSDIAMTLDATSPYPCTYEKIEKALMRNYQWALQCRAYELNPHQSLFGIVHGGTYADLRSFSAKMLADIPFEGYALGGLAVGEPRDILNAMIEAAEPFLPLHKPRYLMGVGTPRNIIEAVMRGMDLFDCAMPTRNARHGTAFTWQGKIHVKAGYHAEDTNPLDPEVPSYTAQFSKAYLRHLFNVDEMTGMTLLTIHNLAFYLDFMKRVRQAIQNNTLVELYARICQVYAI